MTRLASSGVSMPRVSSAEIVKRCQVERAKRLPLMLNPVSTPWASASCSATSGSLKPTERPLAMEWTASVNSLLARASLRCDSMSQTRDCAVGMPRLSGKSSLFFSLSPGKRRQICGRPAMVSLTSSSKTSGNVPRTFSTCRRQSLWSVSMTLHVMNMANWSHSYGNVSCTALGSAAAAADAAAAPDVGEMPTSSDSGLLTLRATGWLSVSCSSTDNWSSSGSSVEDPPADSATSCIMGNAPWLPMSRRTLMDLKESGTCVYLPPAMPGTVGR